MNASLTGKVVIVTGSSQGIGFALAEHLLELGASVVINGRDKDKLNRAAIRLRSKSESLLAVPGDISNFRDCQEIVRKSVAEFGRLDVLVNSAGISMQGELDSLHPSVFAKVVNVNLVGTANMTNLAIPSLRKSNGRVLFISSMAGLLGLPGYSAYSASKMGLTALAQSLQGELAGTGVSVGVAYLGFTENDAAKKVLNRQGDLIPQPARPFVEPTPVSVVVEQVIQMIRTRRRSQFIGYPGPMIAWLNWLAPSFCLWYARKAYRKHIRDELPIAGHVNE